MRAGEGRRRAVARIVVEKPARAFLHAGFARAREVFSLQREREAIPGREREARRPDFDVHAVNFTGSQLLPGHGAGLAATSTNAMTQDFSVRLLQAWRVPRWPRHPPAPRSPSPSPP